MPATSHPAALVAEMEDGRVVAGESAVASDRHGVRRLFLDPRDATANPHAIAAIEGADLIVLGPGSLFTSTLPPLLVPALRRAILSARAPRVYVCNLLQQPGETIGYRASHHLERLHQHVGPESVDIVLVPSEPVIADPLIPVDFDVARLRELGVKVVRRPIADGHHHDPAALAQALARAGPQAVGVSFGEAVRAEMAETLPVASHCRLALLAGVLRAAGRLHLHGRGELHVDCDLASAAVARHLGLAPARERCELRDPHVPRAALRPAGPLPGDRRLGPALAAAAGGGGRARRVARARPNVSRAGSSRARAAGAPTCAAPSSHRAR